MYTQNRGLQIHSRLPYLVTWSNLNSCTILTVKIHDGWEPMKLSLEKGHNGYCGLHSENCTLYSR